MNSETPRRWKVEISPHRRAFAIPVREIFSYRDLLYLFVRRDFVANYKQTVLGPIWFLIQPILTTIMMVFVFGNLAGIPTDGLPSVLFYLGNLVLWGYFSSSFNKNAATFQSNARLFGKVYFPRLITPIGVSISALLTLAIQFILFLVFLLYYISRGVVVPNATLLLFPFLVLNVAMLSMGMGLIFSAFTTKYRDLVNLLSFGTQLLMYASPIVYPLSVVMEKSERLSWVIKANPISGTIETFRHGFMGEGYFSWELLTYSTVASAVVLFLGMLLFNKVEATFMDTV